MRVVSLVPSWTETLLEAGVQVVGRTRFCVHPHNLVAGIPVVGGTKNVDVDRLRALRPDLLILDREENPREMTEIFPDRWWASDVRSVMCLRRDWRALAEVVESERLAEPLPLLDEILGRGRRPLGAAPPAMLATVGTSSPWTGRVPYVIWKDPWMIVNRGTFIASMLDSVGVELEAPEHADLYPRVAESWLRERPALFSSEPYPFAKRSEALSEAGLKGWIVDGEALSWFGIRAVRFLAKEHGLSTF